MRTEKIYVKVTSDFDLTGFMLPRSITWKDGRKFDIDDVRDFRPASTMGFNHKGDCYTIIVKGKQKYLFFEKSNPIITSCIGRWYIEKETAG